MKWILKNKQADLEYISNKYNVSKVIAKLLANRDITRDEDIDKFLNPNMSKMSDRKLLYGIQDAAEIILDAIKNNKRIRIVGDYDADGVCSSVLIYKTITSLTGDASIHIPDRQKDGYGINKSIIDKAINDKIDLIITCDNGIAQLEEAKYAKDNNLQYIVTDHHQLLKDDKGAEIIPVADVVINPHQSKCNYPFKEICGAFVAYLLMRELLEISNIDSYFRNAKYNKEVLINEITTLASIATVTDIMPLINDNRIIVKKGLELIKHTTIKGLKEMIDINNLKDVSSYNVGFIIGPIINASGRLENATLAVDLLLEQDVSKAKEKAEYLVELNAKRKDMTTQGFEQAIEVIEKNDYDKDKVLVVYIDNLHESIAGLVAGRLKEKYYKPVFVITNGEGVCKGSARSIPGYNIFDEMSSQSKLFTKFGGHKMAAGFSIKKENIDILRTSLNESCALTEEDLEEILPLDFAMCPDDVSFKLIDELQLLEPFGEGNPKPLFAIKNQKAASALLMGKDKNTLKINLTKRNGGIVSALMFFEGDIMLNYYEEKYGEEEIRLLKSGSDNNVLFDFTYYPSVNEYRGLKTIQLIIQNYR